jgi:hypothetical protein
MNRREIVARELWQRDKILYWLFSKIFEAKWEDYLPATDALLAKLDSPARVCVWTWVPYFFRTQCGSSFQEQDGDYCPNCGGKIKEDRK